MVEKNIVCIALDLDRTTLDREGRLGETNRKAIEDTIKKGIHVVIASGRSFETLPKDVTSIEGIEYAVTSNGAAVYRVKDSVCLKRYCISRQSVLQILAALEDEHVAYEAFVEGKAYADEDYINNPQRYGMTEKAIDYIRSTRVLVSNIREFIRKRSGQLESMDIVIPDPARKEILWDKIRRSADDIYITSSVDQLIEVSDQNAGKHSGLKYISELLELEPERIAAFGDGNNDTDMLNFVGYGIAVDNASDACKEAAVYITSAHDDDGVAKGIEWLLCSK